MIASKMMVGTTSIRHLLSFFLRVYKEIDKEETIFAENNLESPKLGLQCFRRVKIFESKKRVMDFHIFDEF